MDLLGPHSEDRSLREFLAELRSELRAGLLDDVRAFVRRPTTGVTDHRIAFMRIPKCATTTIDAELRRAYRSVSIFEGNGIQRVRPGACDGAVARTDATTWQARRWMLAYYLAHPKTRYISGHVEVNRAILEGFGDDFSFLTTLRHPVDRWISHYLYNRHGGSDDPEYDIGRDIEGFLELERGQSIGQLTVSYLTGTGSEDVRTRNSERVQKLARRNLDAFDIVGFVERLSDFRETVAERTGIELELEQKNTNPSPVEKDDIPGELRDEIRQACEADLRLYDYARRRLER